MNNMQCTRPILAFRATLNDGTNVVKILPKRVDTNLRSLEEKYGHGSILRLPCGKCLACKLNYSRSWAMRCVLEASCYKDNWFVTLTYDDEHIGDNLLSKSDMSAFMKDLRNKLGSGIRFFGCGEYGEHTKRKHLHLILFNCSLPDVKCLGKGQNGGYYFESKLLRDVWAKGHVMLGDVTFASCNYVARYCVKKVYGEDLPGEFVHMSTHPGIGKPFFDLHKDAIYEDDKIYFKFGSSFYGAPPRYFDKCFETIDPEKFKKIKDRRISSADVSFAAELLEHGFERKEDLILFKDSLNNEVKKRGL